MQYLIIGQGWAIPMGLTVLLTVVLSFILMRVYQRVSTTDHQWRNIIIRALHKPLQFLIWVVGAVTLLAIAQTTWTDIVKFTFIDRVRDVSIILAIIWFLSRFISYAQTRFMMPHGDKEAVDTTTVHAVSRLLQITIFLIGALMVLQNMGVSVSGLLAFGGVGGIAVGFAAKDLLANFFGGLMIYLEKPFKVGDWVRSPEKEIEGTVEYIGWRLTRIKTFDKRPIYVPNAVFTTIVVENPSRMSNRRIKTLVGIRYDDVHRMREVVSDIKEMIHAHEEIDTEQSIYVHFYEFGASSLNIFVSAYTKVVTALEFRNAQQDVFLKIIDIIEKHGAECAFPTSTIHIASNVPGEQPSASN